MNASALIKHAVRSEFEHACARQSRLRATERAIIAQPGRVGRLAFGCSTPSERHARSAHGGRSVGIVARRSTDEARAGGTGTGAAASSPVWDRFLSGSHGRRRRARQVPAARGWLHAHRRHQRGGIAACGDGPTASGKSSYLESMRCALGDYAMTADFETFLTRRGDAGIRNDIARLAGCTPGRLDRGR